MNAAQIEQLAMTLASIAAVISPGNAEAIAALVKAGTELNGIIQRVRQDDPEVWAQIRENYSEAVDAFNQSVQLNNIEGDV